MAVQKAAFFVFMKGKNDKRINAKNCWRADGFCGKIRVNHPVILVWVFNQKRYVKKKNKCAKCGDCFV